MHEKIGKRVGVVHSLRGGQMSRGTKCGKKHFHASDFCLSQIINRPQIPLIDIRSAINVTIIEHC